MAQCEGCFCCMMRGSPLFCVCFCGCVGVSSSGRVAVLLRGSMYYNVLTVVCLPKSAIEIRQGDRPRKAVVLPGNTLDRRGGTIISAYNSRPHTVPSFIGPTKSYLWKHPLFFSCTNNGTKSCKIRLIYRLTFRQFHPNVGQTERRFPSTLVFAPTPACCRQRCRG